MSQGSVLFISGLCLAVIPTRTCESTFLFDSHSCNNAIGMTQMVLQY